MLSNVYRLALNFVLLSGAEAASKVLAFIVFAQLARVLGPDTYGDIEFALAVTLALSLLVEGGLGLYGAREIAKDKSGAVRLAVHVVLLRFALALVAFLLLVLIALFSGKGAQAEQVLILYGLTLFAGAALIPWVFQGLEQMHWIAASSVLRWSLFAAIVLFAGVDPARIWVVPIADLAAIVCVVALHASLFRRYVGPVRLIVDPSFAVGLMRQAIPIGLTQIMWGLKVYLPTIMLGLLVGGAAVGWFGAAHRIVVALHTFVWMYFFNLYPSISRSTGQAPEVLQNLLRRSLQFTSALALFIGITGTLVANPLLTVVYGHQYSEAVTAFQILIWFVAFALISSHYQYVLIAYGRQWLELGSATAGAAMNILMSYFLIPKFGIVGAACALLLAETSVWALNYSFVRRYILTSPVFGYVTRPVIASSRQ